MYLSSLNAFIFPFRKMSYVHTFIYFRIQIESPYTMTTSTYYSCILRNTNIVRISICSHGRSECSSQGFRNMYGGRKDPLMLWKWVVVQNAVALTCRGSFFFVKVCLFSSWDQELLTLLHSLVQ